jgi:hypothetical protein
VYVKPIKFLARWTLARKMGRKGMGILNNIRFHLLSREMEIVSTINDTRFVMYSQSGDHLHVGLASPNLPLLGFGPSMSKGLRTNLKLSTNKIARIHWSQDLGPSSKVALRYL